MSRLGAAALLILLACAALPAAAAMPDYSPERSCADAARRAGNRDGSGRQECVVNETDAKARATSLWDATPESARQRCARLSQRRQSYVTLATCLQREASGTR